MDTIEKIKSKVRGYISEKRFIHSVGVANTAVYLSKIWGGNSGKLFVAGILHDVARDMSAEKLIEIAEKNGYRIDEVEYANPVLLHAPVGAIIAKSDFGITDEEILNCIRYHTTGRKNMSLNEVIIYVSDFIEPSRNFPDAERVRAIADKNLREALLEETYFNVCYLMNKRMPIHRRTIEMFNDFLKKELTKTQIKI